MKGVATAMYCGSIGETEGKLAANFPAVASHSPAGRNDRRDHLNVTPAETWRMGVVVVQFGKTKKGQRPEGKDEQRG